MLDAAEIRRRFPAVHAAAGIVALLREAKPDRFSRKKRSARTSTSRPTTARDLHFDERVEDWERRAVGHDRRAHVARRDTRCGRLILAPGRVGARAVQDRLAAARSRAAAAALVRPGGGAAPFAPDRFPIYIWDLGDGVQFYGFPADDDGRVKVAFFRSKVKGEEAMREALAPCMPALATGALVETVSCKYTLTPDHHFVIGQHPDTRTS